MKKGKKRMLCLLAVLAAAALMAGCAKQTQQTETTKAETIQTSVETKPEETEAETTAGAEETEAETTKTVTTPIGNGAELRIGSLKGPTTMGLVNLMQAAEEGTAHGKYSFTMATQADELLAGMVGGTLDIALVPANVASVLYNKTEGGVSVIDINTLGVLDCVTGDESIVSVKDLAGKTVLTTGQGTTPEYVLNYLLKANGVTDCTLEFKSEATEIAAILQEDASKIAVLPQPFASVATTQNAALKTAFSLTDAWAEVSGDSMLLTAVTVVRNEFLEQYADVVDIFITEQAASTAKAAEDAAGTAELIAAYGIIEKAPIAQKALPQCNLVCITGEEMKTALTGYLRVLFDQDPKSVGGSLPGEDFFYLGTD